LSSESSYYCNIATIAAAFSVTQNNMVRALKDKM